MHSRTTGSGGRVGSLRLDIAAAFKTRLRTPSGPAIDVSQLQDCQEQCSCAITVRDTAGHMRWFARHSFVHAYERYDPHYSPTRTRKDRMTASLCHLHGDFRGRQNCMLLLLAMMVQSTRPMLPQGLHTLGTGNTRKETGSRDPITTRLRAVQRFPICSTSGLQRWDDNERWNSPGDDGIYNGCQGPVFLCTHVRAGDSPISPFGSCSMEVQRCEHLLQCLALRGGIGSDSSQDPEIMAKIRKKEQRGRKKIERHGYYGAAC